MKPINNKNSFSSTTITTTVSKHDLQQRSHLKSSTSNNNLNNTFNSDNSRLDSSTIQIDSINNNNTSPAETVVNKDARNLDSSDDSQIQKKKSIKRNTSLINFKSLDFHIKSIYSGLRNKSQPETPRSTTTNSSSSSTRKPPYLKVEAVDKDESENLLLTYPQSPYQHRGSFDKSCSQLLNITQYEMSRSQASSPYLCPSPGNIRRSSTSDIMCKKSSSANDSRRPSTSDLLRKARERKGSESGRLGRSVSQGGLPRGGYRGGRRTSMAY